MRRIGYAPGAFDLFHVGHLNVLRHARERCDYLIAGVVSDDRLRLSKGANPVVPLEERLEIVRNIRFVDQAVVEEVPNKIEAWREYQFDILFKGDDWRGTKKGVQLEIDMASVNVELFYIPYLTTTSSTALRRAIANMNRLAGRTCATAD
jgi:glycerol-3-phosphate cytidylyltransferase